MEIVDDSANNLIALNFTKKIVVQINGKKYEGQTIEVKDMKTAAEIVRIAKAAYGWQILG